MSLDRLMERVRAAGFDGPVAILSGPQRTRVDCRTGVLVLDPATGCPPRPCDRVLLLEDPPRWAELKERQDGTPVFFPPLRSDHAGGVQGLVEVVDRLLGPGGCPWDQEQTHATLKKHLIEEAYEVLDAIDAGSLEALKEELGDLLMQPVMHAQMECRDGNWDIEEVAQSVADKLVRRHPHVFGDVHAPDADTVLRNWDQIKRTEKGDVKTSILAGVPRSLPALLRAYDVSKRAARVGFEWPHIEAVFEKLREEETELREAIVEGDEERVRAEVGDLLFTVVNLARWAKIEPEDALRSMLDRFTARFRAMELQVPHSLTDLTAEQWDELWRAAKALES